MKNTKTLLFAIALLISVSITFAKSINLQIIYTSDEHGWILKEGKNGGAAEMYHQWLTQASIKHKSTLIISGGDNYTGPAISTFTKGQAMLEVMNAMGYQYSTLGNHELDFGQDELQKVLLNSKYNYLVSNISISNNMIQNLIKPYTIININGLNVLVLGLSNLETPTLSSEKNIKGITFHEYMSSLEKYGDTIRNADFAILLSHICSEQLKTMLPELSEIGFDLITGGHCHNPTAEVVSGIPIIEGMPYMRGYAKIPITFDDITKKIVSISASQVLNQTTIKNSSIDSIVTKWKDSTDKVLNQTIGYADSEINNGSPELLNLILSSWVKQFPKAQIALTNRGSIRQGIPKGNISLSTIMGIMPFDNELIAIEMKGADIKTLITEKKPYIFGIDVNNDFELYSGDKLLDESFYTLIINNFIYNGGDKYDFKTKSKLISNTGINMRDPLIITIKDSKSSWNRPINRILDSRLYFEQ